MTKLKSFWTLFPQILGKLGHKKMLKQSKMLDFGKNGPKSSKILEGGWGGRTCFWRKPKLKQQQKNVGASLIRRILP